MTMDIPGHILEAVQTASDPIPPRWIKYTNDTPRDSPRKASFPKSRSARSSAEDLSTTSDSEQEHGYQTDFTSLPSDSCPEDMQPDEVEDFRDREYPQLKGKTYLDHGGTTVRSAILSGRARTEANRVYSYMRDRSSRSFPQTL